MADETQPPAPPSAVAAGPQTRLPLFAAPENPIPSSGKQAVSYSLGMYGAIAVIALIIASFVPEEVYQAVLPDKVQDLVWVAVEGPGGGGGGSPAPEPPRKAELPKVEPPKPVVPTPEIPRLEVPPPTSLDIPAQTLNAPNELIPGVIENASGTAAGSTGEGRGVGPGKGEGLGPGRDKGVGGGAYKPGNGVSIPRLLADVKPKYTAEAMRARMQGTVKLECVVKSTGSVGDCDVVHSLDGNNFGLDEQALIAAKQWRFAPGTRLGEPVDVLVNIELTFSLR